MYVLEVLPLRCKQDCNINETKTKTNYFHAVLVHFKAIVKRTYTHVHTYN